MTLKLNNIALPPFQSYLAESVSIRMANGFLSTNGALSLAQKDKFSSHFNGSSQISDLAVKDVAGQDLLQWQDLNISGIEFTSQPKKLAIEKVSWQDPLLELTLQPDGTLNISNIAKPKKDSPLQKNEVVVTTPKDESEPMNIDIGSITLAGAKVHFMDQKISPTYETTLDDFSGTITGLSSNKESLAEVKCEGKVNRHSPMSITGSVNPLAEEIFADLKFDFHDLDLSPTSPYTGKFIGYKTDKGKLSLDLHYNIEGKELKAKNKIFLDQFTLGESVVSPDAVNLPISLAIALLKNRKGEIFLDIPVSGKLDDPEFSVGSVVFKVIFNLIAKAATSPFALLGALLPDGEDLQYVSFSPGLADLDTSATKKLTKMAEVLYERPGLRMDIQGSSSFTEDSPALALLRLKHLFLSQDDNASKESETAMTPEQYKHYLTLAYQESLGKKNDQEAIDKEVLNHTDTAKNNKTTLPSSAPEDEKPLSVEFMEKALLAGFTIGEEDLRLLALKRANNVIDLLTLNGKIEPERLFIVEPQMATAKNSEGNKATAKVDFTIK